MAAASVTQRALANFNTLGAQAVTGTWLPIIEPKYTAFTS